MRRLIVILLITILSISFILTYAMAESEPITVRVNPGQILNDDFQGFGIEWDPHAESFVTDSAWETLFERVDYLSPQLVRCMVLARWYIRGIDGDDVTIDLDNYEMRQAMKVLDYCQSHDITVIWGDWGPPGGRRIGFDSVAWAKGMAKCIATLRNEFGYTCIRYCNLGNEPDGSWSDCGDFDLYASGIRNLHSAMKTLDLLDDVSISGPDVYGNWSWLDQALESLNEELGSLDFHWYPDIAGIGAGNLEIRLKRKLTNLSEKLDGRHVFICETGIVDGKNSADQQPNVREYWYGVSLTDALVQYARAGISGAIVWDLEDSMHPTGKEYKTWGFYNMKGGESEQALRPFYYAYSLLCRLFPKGMTIMQTECSDDWGIRILAGSNNAGEFSIAVVNNSDEAKTIHLDLAEIGCFDQLYQYNYFETDRPQDENGFPVVKNIWTSADSLDIEMASNGIVYLTTLKQN